MSIGNSVPPDDRQVPTLPQREVGHGAISAVPNRARRSWSALRAHWLPVVQSIPVAAGVLWLPLEAYEGITNEDVNIPLGLFALLCGLGAVAYYFLDGYFLTGFLKDRVEIKIPGSDTRVVIEFSNLLTKEGWIAVGVNDFFDSIVDEDLVSSRSLHGRVINTYWPNNRDDWQKQISASLSREQPTRENRPKGNQRRFAIGTTACATTMGKKFLFVALGKTDRTNNITTASAETLICAVRGMLRKARAVCSYEELSLPLMGSGLARIGVKPAALVDLILVAIFEETKQAKVTGTINIVLPADKKDEINLQNYVTDWR